MGVLGANQLRPVPRDTPPPCQPAIDLLSRAVRRENGNGAEPTFEVDPEALIMTVRLLMVPAPDNNQKGPEGRRVDGFSPDLLSGLTFFGNRICPFSHRGYWALLEKEAAGAVDYIHIDLNAVKPAWFKERVSSKCLPAIADRGIIIDDAAIVVEYIEARFHGHGTQLMPSDPCHQAVARSTVKFIDSNLCTLFKSLMCTDPSKDREVFANLMALLRELNGRYIAASSVGPYFFGDSLSVVDLAVVPLLARFSVALALYRGFQPLREDDPSVSRLLESVKAAKARPAFAASMPSDEFIAAAYFTYAAGAPAPACD